MTVVGIGKIAVLGINLEHWRLTLVYRLILLFSLLQRISVSAMNIQIIRRFPCQYRRCAPNCLGRFPVLNKGGDGDVEEILCRWRERRGDGEGERGGDREGDEWRQRYLKEDGDISINDAPASFFSGSVRHY